jgi:NAD(P)-dependent dehydrogenase (short-subunit alcohol dehydrogenase family)
MGTIADRTVLVTGANRGIGHALVEEALRRGANRVYAGTRQPLAHSNGRVTPLTLDVTDAPQTRAAVDIVESLDLLIKDVGNRPDLRKHRVSGCPCYPRVVSTGKAQCSRSDGELHPFGCSRCHRQHQTG